MAASMAMRLYLGGLRKSFREIRKAEYLSYASVSRHYEVAKQNFSKRLQFLQTGKRSYGDAVVPTVGFVGILRGFFGFFEKREEEDPVKVHIRLAYLAIKKEQYKEAENYYHLALHAAEEQFKLRHIDAKKLMYTRVYVYDGMANLALSQGQLEKAERLYKETMKGCLEKGISTTDNSMVELSIKLASTYAMMGRDDEAHVGYKFCVDTQEAKIKENPEADENTYALLGISYESYARLLMQKKDYEPAEAMLKKSEEIANKYLGENHPQRIVILNDLASVQILKKDYRGAEGTLTKAVEVGEGTQDITLPVLYCNLGSLYMRTSDLAKALEYCEIGQSKAKSMKNKDALNQANFCINKIREEQKKEGKT